MSLVGNKGEWSEAYVLLKLLAEKKLQLGDEHLNILPDVVYPILKIIRFEKEKTEFSFDSDVVVMESEQLLVKIPVAKFLSVATELFTRIKKSKGVVAYPDTEEFLNSINVYQLKASSQDKTDITIQIQDINSPLQPIMGFSIKSQLGSPSTLLNAGATTNFTYKIAGKTLSAKEVSEINAVKSISEKLNLLRASGRELRFFRNDSDVFKLNLQTIDTHFPEVIAEMLVLNYSNLRLTTLKEIVEKLTELNPLNYDLAHGHNMYEIKVKRFLTDFALGMRAAKVWDGIYETTGGYLIVRNDGEVLCYHFYYRNQFENYLLANTKFETASTSRHGFGNIYSEQGQEFMKLNLQIRFLI